MFIVILTMTEAPSDFQSTVDMTDSNFLTHLPRVLETIKGCDFVAFDLEFSGTDYKPYFLSVYADTVCFSVCTHPVVRNALCEISCRVCFVGWSDVRSVENFYPIEVRSEITQVMRSWGFVASHGMQRRSGKDSDRR